MNIKNIGRLRLAVLLALVALTVPAVAMTPDRSARRREKTYTGTIVTFNGRTRGFTLRIKSFTPQNQVESDISALRSGGQDAFQEAIEKQNLGSFELTGNVSKRLRFVTRTKMDTGTRIVAVFDRWLQPFELRYGTRSVDYPFTYLEIFKSNSGKVTGTIIGAARVEYKNTEPGKLEFENFAVYPAKLVGISVRPKMA